MRNMGEVFAASVVRESSFSPSPELDGGLAIFAAYSSLLRTKASRKPSEVTIPTTSPPSS